MTIERVPRWRLGWRFIPYYRVGQSAWVVSLGPYRIYVTQALE